MDHRLVAWGHAVKVKAPRVKAHGAKRDALPPLWLFTDTARLPDPCAAARRLPRGLCGVVLRHDDAPNRASLARRLAAICRARRLVLSVAGDWRLAASLRKGGLLAGVHLRGGRRPVMPRNLPALTSSAHGEADLHRAARSGVRLAFLSPAFATASHPGARGLGAVRWAGLASHAGLTVGALGGIDGHNLRRLPGCRHAGAIGALS